MIVTWSSLCSKYLLILLILQHSWPEMSISVISHNQISLLTLCYHTNWLGAVKAKIRKQRQCHSLSLPRDSRTDPVGWKQCHPYIFFQMLPEVFTSSPLSFQQAGQSCLYSLWTSSDLFQSLLLVLLFLLPTMPSCLSSHNLNSI